MGCIKRNWYLSPMRAAKVHSSLRIRAVSPEPLLLAHTSSESSGTFRQKARSLAPQNGCTCSVKICHDGMLEDTNSLDAPQIINFVSNSVHCGSSLAQCLGCNNLNKVRRFIVMRLQVRAPAWLHNSYMWRLIMK